jgi:endonuclease YncB( thermonuclease family)
MQRYRLLAGAAVAVAIVGFVWWPASSPPEQSSPDSATESGTSVPVPAEAPAPEPAQAAAEPPPPALPKLSTREIAARPTHTVPEDQIPPSPRPFEFKQASGLPASSPPSSPPPRSTATAALPRAQSAQQLAGAAQASGATALLVGGQPLSLFGVRPPSTTDRCLGTGGFNIGAPNCADRARDTLAARLAHDPHVSCRVPSPKTAASAAICLDAEGVDLGGLLVAEGLALADPSQSYDYVGAETVARTQGRGLWHFR